MSVEEKLVNFLVEHHFTITTAESCTGGLVSSKIVNVPGASDVLNLCVTTYSNEAKEKILNVKEDTLRRYGAVSEETAYEMAKGAAAYAVADVAISITGIAGPGGGSALKPVGLVYIGCNVCGNITVKRCLFAGDREAVREQAAVTSLELALECVERYLES